VAAVGALRAVEPAGPATSPRSAARRSRRIRVRPAGSSPAGRARPASKRYRRPSCVCRPWSALAAGTGPHFGPREVLSII